MNKASALPSRRTIIGGAAGLAASLAMPAIVTRAAADDDWQDGAGADWAKVLAAGRSEGSVVVGAPGIAGQAMVDPFKRDTGITLELFAGSPNAITSRVQAELEAKRVTIDVILGGQAELAFLDRLRPLDSELLLPKVNGGQYWRNGRIKWVDSENRKLVQATEYVAGWLVVDTEAVKDSDITSWKNLLDAKYQGRVGSYDPLIPGPGFACGTWLIGLFGADFVTDLFIKQKIGYTPDTNLLVEWVARKKYDIALGGIQAALETFRDQGFRDTIKPLLPYDAPGYLTGGYSVLKMPQGLPHPNAATVFLNWYLSRPGATAYSNVMLESSRRIDVKLPEVLSYIVPHNGINYVDVYNETAYRKRPEQLVALKAALAQR
jgi:ABC-type Fe3+ transport system substrate-binding protein